MGDFRLLQAGKQISGVLLAMAVAAVFAACSNHVSEDLTTAALSSSGDAVITMAAVMDRNLEMSCMNLRLETLDGKLARNSSGKLMSSIKLGSGTIFDGGAEVIGSAQIAPGTYKIAAVSCKPPGGKSGILDVLSANPKGFATFSVAAGEVVNLGKLIVIEVQAEPGGFMKDERYVYAGHVAPLQSDPRTALNKELGARLVDRMMTASQQPLPQAELARICQEKRVTYASAVKPPNPAACRLAGI